MVRNYTVSLIRTLRCLGGSSCPTTALSRAQISAEAHTGHRYIWTDINTSLVTRNCQLLGNGSSTPTVAGVRSGASPRIWVEPSGETGASVDCGCPESKSEAEIIYLAFVANSASAWPHGDKQTGNGYINRIARLSIKERLVAQSLVGRQGTFRRSPRLVLKVKIWTLASAISNSVPSTGNGGGIQTSAGLLFQSTRPGLDQVMSKCKYVAARIKTM
jgi:hypothetical protein